MSSSLSEFNDFTELLSKFSPVVQRKALREAARFLLLSNRKRLRANIEPSGAAMQARQNGTRKMFQKMGKHLQLKNNSSETAVGYYGSAGRVATNHQLGKTLKRSLSGGRVSLIDLPVRELLGLDDEDRFAVEQIFMKHMELSDA